MWNIFVDLHTVSIFKSQKKSDDEVSFDDSCT